MKGPYLYGRMQSPDGHIGPFASTHWAVPDNEREQVKKTLSYLRKGQKIYWRKRPPHPVPEVGNVVHFRLEKPQYEAETAFATEILDLTRRR